MKTILLTAIIAMVLLAHSSTMLFAGDEEPAEYSADEKRFAALRDAYLKKFRPLYVEASRAWWEAATTGDDAAFKRREKADNALVELHSDKSTFEQIKSLRKAGNVQNPLLARQLDVMYRSFLAKQGDGEKLKRIIAIETQVEKIFNTHRSEVGGEKLTENDVRKILRETTDSEKAKAAWMGYTRVGEKVEAKLKEVVKLRNQVATELGYKNYYALRLAEQEIDEKQLVALFDELDRLTRKPFAKVKKKIDERMAKRFGIQVSELRPWHFGDLFFQEAPPLGDVDLDAVFADADLIKLTEKYYAGLGLPCDDIIERSDLYEKPGKSPHAFATDLDREGDIRVLCNLKPNMQWADTLMHEIGHAVYDKYISPDLPFLLREASHSITTEGLAMMLGALVKTEDWLINIRGLSPEQAAKVVAAAQESLRVEKLLFSRWSQVMMRFERSMYANPDQDLSKLWWDLKQEYQLMNPPDDLSLPGYAAKVHVLTVPVYYHSYLMGDLFAAQVHAHIARDVLGVSDPKKTSFVGSLKAGLFLRDKIFGPGNAYSWNELTRHATGEYLTAKYFAEKFVN